MTESPPKDHGRAALIGSAILAAVVYLLTAARVPIFGDGLELVAAAAIGGVPHPPGYPLLMMLLAPIASGPGAYFRATILCAIFVLAAGLLLARAWKQLNPSTQSNQPQLWEPFFPAALLGFFLFSTTAWSAATLVEVYTLNALLLAGIVVAMVPSPEAPHAGRRIAIASLLLGLAMCNHLSALCMGPLILLRWIQVLRAAPPRRERLLALAAPLVFLIGLLPWLYVPIRSAALPAINWGGGHTREGFIWLLRGGDYGRMQLLQERPGLPFTLETWLTFAWERTLLILSVLGGEALGADTRLSRILLIPVGLGVLALTIFGAVRLFRRDRILVLGLGIALLLQLAFVMLYNITDIEDYFLGIWTVGFLLLALGLHALLHVAADRFGYTEAPEKQKRMVVLLALILLVMIGSNWRVADRTAEPFVPQWTNAILNTLPQNAVILAHADYDTYPLWYALHAEGRRPDLFLISTNFMRYEWYADMIPGDDPLGRTAIPEPGDVLVERYTLEDHVGMIHRGAVAPNIDRAPIYSTSDGFRGGPGLPPTMASLLGRHYTVEPAAVLLSDELLVEMFERYRLYAPPVLDRITPR